MVKLNDLFTSINKLLISLFRSHTVYTQSCPKDFKRPSFLIEYVKTTQSDVNRFTIEKTAYFTITGFTKIDSYYRSEPSELISMKENVLELFSDGYVQVGDRSIKVKSSSGGMDTDRIYIELQFEYFDERNTMNDTTPFIATVITNIQEG